MCQWGEFHSDRYCTTGTLSWTRSLWYHTSTRHVALLSFLCRFDTGDGFTETHTITSMLHTTPALPQCAHHTFSTTSRCVPHLQHYLTVRTTPSALPHGAHHTFSTTSRYVPHLQHYLKVHTTPSALPHGAACSLFVSVSLSWRARARAHTHTHTHTHTCIHTHTPAEHSLVF